MKKMKWIALLLVLCLLVLPGCGASDPETPAGNENQSVQGNQSENGTKDWEEILTYAEYLNMTKQEQDAFYASFEDPMDFFAWFKAVKAIYDEERKDYEFDGSGSIDIGGMSGE